MKRFGQRSVAIRVGALVLAVTGAAFAGTGLASASPPTPAFQLTSATGFTITSKVTNWPGCSGPTALLYPGVTRCLTYTVHNSRRAPLSVTSITISGVNAPAGCPASNLDLTRTTFSGALFVGVKGAASAPVPFSMIETNTNQDPCENTIFAFTFSGKAAYALPPGCSGHHDHTFVGNPSDPTINGTEDEHLIFAFGADYTVHAKAGHDCIYAGDGNNTLIDGNGDDVVVAGDGNNVLHLGHGRDRVTLGNGDNTIRIKDGHDTVTVGNGHNTIYLGSGSDNTFTGGTGTNVCHLPDHDAAYYHDTLTNCTVVTP